MKNYIPFKPSRVASIDVLRALTMMIMIFVNDLGSVAGVPHWLEHAAMTEDFLGFSDLVFPAFLICMGMSIPMAIESRLQKEGTKFEIIESIASRTFALIIMGLLLLNAGQGISVELGINRNVFMIVALIGFLLVWNLYPKVETQSQKTLQRVLKIAGAMLLTVLIYIYRSPDGGMFQQGWWGILGLIGWAYGFCAVIYLFCREKPWLLVVAYFVFLGLTALGSSKLLGPFHLLIPDNGCHHAFAMTGLLTTLLLQHKGLKHDLNKRLQVLGIIGVVFIILGLASNHIWIISKIQATPPWLFYCSGITLLFYIFIYWLTDMKGKASWFNIIKPAGTATLTCYLMSYLFYAVISLIGFKFPDFLLVHPVGLLKCLGIALFTIGLTALVGKVGIKLKV